MRRRLPQRRARAATGDGEWHYRRRRRAGDHVRTQDQARSPNAPSRTHVVTRGYRAPCCRASLTLPQQWGEHFPHRTAAVDDDRFIRSLANREKAQPG